MNRTLLTLAAGVGLCLAACAGAEDSSEQGTDTDAAATSGGPTAMTTTGDPIPTTVTVSGSSSSTDAVPATDGQTETGDPPGQTGETGETSTGEESMYEFDEAEPEAYTQVDRMGMPAINTAVITSKDQYNRSTPQDDVDGVFVDEIVANLTGLHAALDDDLMVANLTPCAVKDCVAQAAPLVLPDTLTITLGGTVGFPNGRLPTDPVMDVTLAVVLLDLSIEGQNALSLVGLNPTENDVPFLSEFPYFAEPH